jgi:hypothetical protein
MALIRFVIMAGVALAAGATVLRALGALRWGVVTRDLRAPLERGLRPVGPSVFEPRLLEGLPAPVQRYFGKVLTPGQRMLAGAWVRHEGRFNMSPGQAGWRPFVSNQLVVTQRPGFIWDARIRVAPGLNMHVHDAYVAGEGVLHARLLGLFPVMSMPSSPELARGEFMRFVAEASWYPTALLPGQGVTWEPVDERQARATMTDGDTSVTMVVRFNDQDLIESVTAQSRGREVKGAVVPTPWQGRCWDYVQRDGMLIPLEGEVAWLLPEGPQPYWRGRITELTYAFAE